MRNLADEKPMDPLYGRKKIIIRDFIEEEDLEHKKVLNIGCGFGWFEYYTKEKAEHLWAVEPEAEGMQTALEYLGDDDRISFQTGSATGLPFPDGTFDTVVSFDVIEHIPAGAERKMLKEIERVLKPGGVVYLTTRITISLAACSTLHGF